MISTKAAKVLFGKSERNGALMKSQTNDTWNRQIVRDKSECQIAVYEVNSFKMEIT